MRYVWDRAKDGINKRKHGFALAEGIPALQDPERDSWIDSRYDYGEERICTLGMGQRQVLYVVSTERDENYTRLISVRRAEKDEFERYGLGRS